MKTNKPKLWLALAALAGLVLDGAHPAGAQQIITNFATLNGTYLCAVNPALNKIYLALGSPAAQPIVVVDGVTYSQTTAGNGDDVCVDGTNNNYWSAGVYSDSVTAWNSSNTALSSPATGCGCALAMSMDAPHRRVWTSAQCCDGIWIFNADTYATIAGPISTGGVGGNIFVNPATGRGYFENASGSQRVNPSTFAVTANAFGQVIGANVPANLLYAYAGSGTSLQIINGAPDPEVVLTNITLPFTIGASQIGVNPGLNRIYIGYSTNMVAILNATNGQILGNVSLGNGVTGVGKIVVDATRNLVYASTYTTGALRLFVLQDNPSAPVFHSATYLGIASADVTGTGIKYYGGAVYACANNSASSGLIASYPAPLVSSAAPAWNATWPDSTPSDLFWGITASSNGLYLASMDYTRTTDTVGGKEDKGLVLKFPFTGATGGGFGGDIWDQQTPAAPGAFSYGGSEGLAALTVASESGTNFIYTTGSGQQNGANGGRLFVSKLAENATVIWTQTDGAEMVGNAVSGGRAAGYVDGNVYLAGITCDANTYGQPYLRKYSPAGALAWKRSDSSVGLYNGITSMGTNLYAVGYSGTNTGPTATLDFLIDKWDENGNQIWSRTYDRSAQQSSLNAVLNVNGRLFAAGYTRGSTAGGADAVLVEIDPATGNLLSTTLYGGSQDDLANGLDSDGANLYVVGQTRSFGNGSNQLMVLDYSLAAPTLTNIVVAPANAVIAAGSNQLYSATGYYSDLSSSLLSPTNGLVWSSSNPGTATITTNGLAAGLTQGVTFITAVSGAIAGSNTLTVVTTPTIATNPMSATATSGGSVTLHVAANGGVLSYQWTLNGTNLSGATGASLTITNFTAANAGTYTVKISNVAGSVTSLAVTLATEDIKLFAGVIVYGPLGSNYLIQATSNLTSNWTTLTNVSLPTQPYIYIDYRSPTNAQQFYRAVPQ